MDSGAMASHLCFEIFHPEAQALLLKISSTLAGDSKKKPDGMMAEGTMAESTTALIKDLHQRIFPKIDEAGASVKTLFTSLQKKINPADTPTMAENDEAKANEVKASETRANEAKAAEARASLIEANPFSLINIKRRATFSIPAYASKVAAEANAQKTPQTTEKIERTTVSYKKKLMQSRFSRRRFLRDYNGTTILSVIATFLLFASVSIGASVGNIAILIPKTRVNKDAGQRAETFRSEITFNEPKLTKLLQRRQSIELKLEKALAAFVDTNQIRDDFSKFISVLEDDPRIEVSGQQIEAIESELENIESIVVSFNVRTSFLLWLKYRNEMIRRIGEINVIEERIEAPAGQPTIDIFIKMSRPGRNSINSGA